jgi:hypothetical protein
MTTTPEQIAHVELAVRVALEQAELDVRDPVTAAALLSIAVDVPALDTRDNVLAMVGELYDAARGFALP